MEEAITVMNEKKAAKYIGLSPKTLQKYRWEQKPPTYIKVGSAVRYHKDDLDAFLDSNRVEPLNQ
jgi:hypothetical protein